MDWWAWSLLLLGSWAAGINLRRSPRDDGGMGSYHGGSLRTGQACDWRGGGTAVACRQSTVSHGKRSRSKWYREVGEGVRGQV